MTAEVGARGRVRSLVPSRASFPGWGVRLFSLLLLLTLWHVSAMRADSHFYPTPIAVAKAGWAMARPVQQTPGSYTVPVKRTVGDVIRASTMIEITGLSVQIGELPYHIGVTLIRATIAFVVAMILGSVVGIMLGRKPMLNWLFDSWIVLGLNMPALVTAILCYIYLGLNTWALILAVAINKIPLVAVTMREGASAIEPELIQVGRAFRLSTMQMMRKVFLPQLYPYFMASWRTGLALVWKIVLVFELLGFSNGVGFVLQLHFQLGNVDRLLAYAVGFIAVVMVIEALVTRPLERRATLWRL